MVRGQDALPTQGCYDRFDDLKRELAGILDRLQVVLDDELSRFQEVANNLGARGILVPR